MDIHHHREYGRLQLSWFMQKSRAEKVERRLLKAVALVERRAMNAQHLAKALKVSLPTIQRLVAELRLRGYSIRSVRDAEGWRYEIVSTEQKRPD